MKRWITFLLLPVLLLIGYAQTRQTVNVGTTANDGTGDTPRSAFTKVNTNFFELWAQAFTNLPASILTNGSVGKMDSTNGFGVGVGSSNTTLYGTTTFRGTNLATTVDLKAGLDSPALTGTPTAPTASPGDSSTKIATTAFLGYYGCNLVPFEYCDLLSPGTNAWFNAGRVTFQDGSTLDWPGGLIACIANRTNYIGVNIFTGEIHALRRKVDHGTIFFGTVVCDADSITDAWSYPIQLPPGRMEGFKAAIKYPQHGQKVIFHGNSIMSAAFGDTTNQWADAIFTTTASPTTWQLPNLSGLTLVDRSYGGQLSMDAMSFTGVGTSALVVTNDNRSAAWIAGADYIARNGASYIFQPDAALARADLVVIYDYFNGGRENLFWIETLCRKYRAMGCEVLLCIDNRPRDTDPSTEDLYAAYPAIADRYGCALADAQSYMEELQANGVTVHADINHPNQAGNDAIAEAVRGVMNTRKLVQDHKTAPEPFGRAAQFTDYGYTNGVYPRRYDFQFIPVATTGSYVATGIPSTSDYIRCIPGINLAQRTTNDCVLELEENETATFAHPFAMGMRLIVEPKLASGSSLQVNAVNGTVTKTFNFLADDPSVKGNEGLLASEILISNSAQNNDPTGHEVTASPMRNWTVVLKSSTGTTRILGVAWHTVPWEEIPKANMSFVGQWNTDSFASLIQCPTTDTTGSAVTFSFVGTGASLILAQHPSAGKVDIWLDGVPIYSDLNLLESQGRFTRNVLCLPSTPHAGYGVHTLRLVHDGNTGSAAAIDVGLRRLMLLGAYALDTR